MLFLFQMLMMVMMMMMMMDDGSRLGVAKRAQNCLRGRHRASRLVCVEPRVLPARVPDLVVSQGDPPHEPHEPPHDPSHEEAKLLGPGGCAHRFHQRPRTEKKCIVGVSRSACNSRLA